MIASFITLGVKLYASGANPESLVNATDRAYLERIVSTGQTLATFGILIAVSLFFRAWRYPIRQKITKQLLYVIIEWVVLLAITSVFAFVIQQSLWEQSLWKRQLIILIATYALVLGALLRKQFHEKRQARRAGSEKENGNAVVGRQGINSTLTDHSNQSA